jgi:hypothetical protein
MTDKLSLELFEAARAFFAAQPNRFGPPLRPVVLPSALYDRAAAHGIDMRTYVRAKPAPSE